MSHVYCKSKNIFQIFRYSDGHLDKLNGFILSPNSNVTVAQYNFISGLCDEWHVFPMNEYFPVIFSVERTCQAAIPIYSSIGTENLISVTGYGELIVATQSKIKEITFIYTAPQNDCTLKLTSMIMLDIQCMRMDRPVSPVTSKTPSKTSLSEETTVEVSKTNQWITKVSSDTKYTSIRTTPRENSLDNPVYHFQLPICPVKHERLRIIMTKVYHKHAAVVCLRKGLRLAVIRKYEMAEAVGMLGTCLGLIKSVWIQGYWHGTSKQRQCLELSVGPRARLGSINIPSSCYKEQAVLCEDPYFPS